MNAEGGSEKLINGIRSGSVEAFDRFYELHSIYVYHIALKMTQNRSDAEDLCHDVFVEVFRHADQFDASRGSVKAWLAIKTKSRFLDSIRKSKRSILGLDRADRPDPHSKVDEILSKKWDRERVLAAINELPDSQQQAVYEKYFKYRTQNEIASEMNKPIGTVKSLIRYGLKNLRRQLTGSGTPEPSGGDRGHER